MTDIGLILEGGGMRGAYTAGALDYLLDAKLEFSKVYGVSAGVCHACSYISKQRGRAIEAVMISLGNWKYGTVRSLLVTGDFFHVRYLYENLPKSILPFDYDVFENSKQSLIAVVTNVSTGEAEYHKVSDDMKWIRASASLPLISRLVSIGGTPYLDGGVSDPVPLEHSIKEGNKKNVMILTRHSGYRKTPSDSRIMKLKYRKHPGFIEKCLVRHQIYNDSLDLALKEEMAGNALIIRPEEEVKIGRLEKNKDKLQALYESGYQDAKRCIESNKEFFE